MATQMRMKLPSLKLTQRLTQGVVRHRTVPRGMTTCSSPGDETTSQTQECPEAASFEESGATSLEDDGESPMLNVDGYDQDLSGPSLHDIRQKAASYCCLGKEPFCHAENFH